MPYLLSDLDDRSFLKNRRTDFRAESLSQYSALVKVKPPSVGGALAKIGPKPSGGAPRPRLAARVAYRVGQAAGSLTGRAKRIKNAVAQSKTGQRIAQSRVGQTAIGLGRKGYRGVKKVGRGGLNLARQGFGAARASTGFSRYDLPSSPPKLLSYRNR